MIANVAGMAGSNYLDLKLDQFGLTRAPGEGKASFNLCGILNYALSNDNCLYDLTLHGAQELNAKIGAVENVVLFLLRLLRHGAFGGRQIPEPDRCARQHGGHGLAYRPHSRNNG